MSAVRKNQLHDDSSAIHAAFLQRQPHLLFTSTSDVSLLPQNSLSTLNEEITAGASAPASFICQQEQE
jgi:hypothetical protein